MGYHYAYDTSTRVFWSIDGELYQLDYKYRYSYRGNDVEQYDSILFGGRRYHAVVSVLCVVFSVAQPKKSYIFAANNSLSDKIVGISDYLAGDFLYITSPPDAPMRAK